MEDILKILAPHNFIRIHRKWIINKSKIKAINTSKNKIILNDKEYPIGRSYRKEIIKRLTKV